MPPLYAAIRFITPLMPLLMPDYFADIIYAMPLPMILPLRD